MTGSAEATDGAYVGMVGTNRGGDFERMNPERRSVRREGVLLWTAVSEMQDNKLGMRGRHGLLYRYT
jgi:hypothetical protein